MTMNFNGRAKRLEDTDLPRVGHEIGVGEDEIHAVMEVEAAGSGFDAKGRPKMLFEPHVFYRCLPVEKRQKAIDKGLAYKSWRRGAYPADSYPRLIAAMEIDEEAALKAASWGLGQILGENHVAAGYATARGMVLDFMDDEDNHLEAMIRFIKHNRLDDEIRAHNWAGFARGYNGPAYAEHGYHTRLAAAFAKWRKIKDTPWSPGQGAGAPPAPAVPPQAPRPAPTPAPAPAQPVPTPQPAPAPPVLEPIRNDGAFEPPKSEGFWSRFLAAFRKRTAS